MKKIFSIIMCILLLTGCSKTGNSTVTENDPSNHTFLNNVDLESFMHPLTENGALTKTGDSEGDEFAKERGIVYTDYIYNDGNWGFIYTEQSRDGKKLTILDVYDAPLGTSSNVILSMSTGDSGSGTSLQVQGVAGGTFNLTMDRKNNEVVGCVAYATDYSEKECTDEQLKAGAIAQEKMSTILSETLTKLNVDLTKTNINFYENVNITSITNDTIPVWSGENPIPEMEEKASKNTNYVKSETSEGYSIYYSNDLNNVSIEFKIFDKNPYLYIQLTPIIEGERYAVILSATYSGYESNFPSATVSFSTENNKYSCEQSAGNSDDTLRCNYSDGTNFIQANDEQVGLAKEAIVVVRQLFTDLGVDFDKYFNLDNLK